MMATEKHTFMTKLYECAVSGTYRPEMSYIYFQDNTAYATNGTVAIRQTLEFHSVIDAEKLEERCIHRDSWKSIMGFDFAQANDIGIDCRSESGATALFEFGDPPKPEFVESIKNIISKHNIAESVEMPFVGVSPDHIATVAKAIHSPAKQLKIEFKKSGESYVMIITAPDVSGQMALLMPVMLTETLF